MNFCNHKFSQTLVPQNRSEIAKIGLEISVETTSKKKKNIISNFKEYFCKLFKVPIKTMKCF